MDQQKTPIDIYNYFSIEILEAIGIASPNQSQIDKVENLLRKITTETGRWLINAAKQ